MLPRDVYECMNAELVHGDVQYQSVCIHHTVLTGELCVCVCLSVYPLLHGVIKKKRQPYSIDHAPR